MECQPQPTTGGDPFAARAHLEDLLDRALEDSFPASDPIGIAHID